MNLSVAARLIAAVAMVTVVAACGSDDKDSAASKPPATTSAASPSGPSAYDLSSIPRTYDQACNDLLSFFKNGEDIARQNHDQSFSAADEAKRILDTVKKNDEWKNLSDNERSDVARGINTAATGKC